MDSKPVITLPPDLVELCRSYARAAVAAYASGENSTALSSHGAEKNEDLWANAKGAECAFALWMGREPRRDLHWANKPDAGFDLAEGVLTDVKQTDAGHFLVWPLMKNSIYVSKRFDVLVMARGRLPTFTMCGWETKTEFYRRKHVAGSPHKLTLGTWHLHEDEIQDIHRFKSWVDDVTAGWERCKRLASN